MSKVAVLLAEGFEEIEALTVVDVMRRANINCDMISISQLDITGSHNIMVKADKILGEDIKEYDLLVLPGGMPGSKNLKEDERVVEVVKWFNEKNKFIGAICAAPIVLGKAGIIKDRSITSYPGYEDELKGCNYLENDVVVVDGNLITSRGPATTLAFSYKLLEVLGNESYSKLSEGMMYNFLIK